MLTYLLMHRRATVIIAAAVLLAFVLVALPAFVSSASAVQVDSGWYYVCRWTTEWWDPWNWFGTGKTRCFTEWRP